MQYIGSGEIPLAVSVEEYKRARHFEPDDVDDDLLIEMLLGSAQETVVTATGRPLGELEYEFVVPGFWRRWWFPCAPVKSVTEIATDDQAGDWTVQDLTGVRLVQGFDEPQLLLPLGWSGFAGGQAPTRIRAVVGYPEGHQAAKTLRQAIILLAREWHEAGITTSESAEPPRLTLGVSRLIQQRCYRRPRETDDC